ncbi:unnamed protein product [Caretta caretta]
MPIRGLRLLLLMALESKMDPWLTSRDEYIVGTGVGEGMVKGFSSLTPQLIVRGCLRGEEEAKLFEGKTEPDPQLGTLQRGLDLPGPALIRNDAPGCRTGWAVARCLLDNCPGAMADWCEEFALGQLRGLRIRAQV